MIETFFLRELAQRGLSEDLLYGDKTTEALFPRPFPAVGRLIAHQEMILAGLDLFETVFKSLDPAVSFETTLDPGAEIRKGQPIATLRGDGRVLLKAERVALNFLQHLSGVATLTRKFVRRVEGTPVKIVDTRKTTPGLRALEKEAVRAGGGFNHRFHLGDLVLIKDNHIALAGGITGAVLECRASLSHPLKIEVEVTTLQEVKEAVACRVEMILLDNMALPAIRQAVDLIRSAAASMLIEVSGGVQLENVAEIARCGVDLISVGALTHSAPAVDVSLEIEPLTRAVPLAPLEGAAPLAHRKE